MKNTNKRLYFVMVILTTFIFLLTNCVNNQGEKIVITNAQGEEFAGSSACQNCHREIYDDFIHTPHYLTSQQANKKTVDGSFVEGKNVYDYTLFDKVAMEDRDSGLFQVEYYHGTEKAEHRFDIVIGSGTRGQTYLYWQGNRLFELPVSFFAPLSIWSNSPGYPAFAPFFGRPVSASCLKCHSTYFENLEGSSVKAQEFDQTKIIYGVDCERCHGPGQKHVEYQMQHPSEKQGKYIIDPAVFTRQQKLDMCALCHSGIWKTDTPPFTFTPGDTLSKFLPAGSKPLTDTSHIDVHGNEYGLLIASKCFKMTATLECNTCHDTHKNQRANLALFSQKCIACHNREHGSFCKIAQSIGSGIKTNCIDCHMPILPSKVLSVELENHQTPVPATIRKHYIAIYPAATQKFLNSLK